MVSYKKKLRKKLKYKTLKYMNGGGMIIPSPFMIVMKSIKNMMYYTLLSLSTLPVYVSTVLLNFPLNSLRNITNGRYKDTPFKDNPLYKIAYNPIDNKKINLLKQEQEKGEIITPEGTTFINGALYKGHVKGMIPQKQQNGGALPSVGSLKTMVPIKVPSVDSFKTMASKVNPLKTMTPTVNPLKTMTPTVNPLKTMTPTVNPLKTMEPTNIPTVNSLKTMVHNKVPSVGSQPPANVQISNNKTKKRDNNQIKKIKDYYKERITYKNDRETFINNIKSIILPNSQKSNEVFAREYDTASKNTMDTIYRMEMSDSQRINDENSILKRAMNKLSSDVLLKAIILFNTVFDTSYNPNDENSNSICTSYLNTEKKYMGINNDSETIPTYWNPIPVVTVKNVFKYKNGLNPLYFGSKTFAKCLQSNLTKTEFSKEDMELCVDLIDQDCPDCTLNSTLTNIIESYKRLLTGKIEIDNMINTLFIILLKMYKNNYKNKNNYNTEKNYEISLVGLYLTQIRNSNFDAKKFLEYVNYENENGMTFNKFIGDVEIKMFKDIMCKYKLREKLFNLYILKKQEETEKIRKLSQTEREKKIKHDLIKFLGIFLDTSQLNSNNHLTIQEIENLIKQFFQTNVTNNVMNNNTKI